MRTWPAALALTIGCAGAGPGVRGVASLRPACGAGELWDGKACQPTAEQARHLAAGKAALAESNVDGARAELDQAEKAGPLPHDANVALWEQRGIAAAYVDDEAGARQAFDMLLALDPGHFLSYTLSPKATFVFEKVRGDQARATPALDVTWSRSQRLGDPIAVDVEVIADPKRFLQRATLYVRAHGEASWRAADLTLPTTSVAGDHRRVVLPGLPGTKPTSLELYLRGVDARGDEVLAWADPARPRELPLRYEPEAPWYKKWWVITLASSAVALGTGGVVYALTVSPPAKVGGTVR
jgi:hypothetical protein